MVLLVVFWGATLDIFLGISQNVRSCPNSFRQRKYHERLLLAVDIDDIVKHCGRRVARKMVAILFSSDLAAIFHCRYRAFPVRNDLNERSRVGSVRLQYRGRTRKPTYWWAVRKATTLIPERLSSIMLTITFNEPVYARPCSYSYVPL